MEWAEGKAKRIEVTILALINHVDALILLVVLITNKFTFYLSLTQFIHSFNSLNSAWQFSLGKAPIKFTLYQSNQILRFHLYSSFTGGTWVLQNQDPGFYLWVEGLCYEKLNTYTGCGRGSHSIEGGKKGTRLVRQSWHEQNSGMPMRDGCLFFVFSLGKFYSFYTWSQNQGSKFLI